MSSRVCKPHLMTPPVSQGFRYWGLTSTCGTTKTDAAVARVSSPASRPPPTLNFEELVLADWVRRASRARHGPLEVIMRVG